MKGIVEAIKEERKRIADDLYNAQKPLTGNLYEAAYNQTLRDFADNLYQSLED